MDNPILVIGGGVAGLSAALTIAQANVPVILTEKNRRIGGFTAQFCCKATDTCAYCGACMADEIIREAHENPLIDIHLDTELDSVIKTTKGFGIKFAHIRDGTSNVIALGERRWQFRDVTGSNTVARAAVIFGIADRDDNPRVADQLARGRTKLNYTGTDAGASRQGFSSDHPGGAQFGFADGSVHFISETIDADMDDTQESVDNAVNSTWERLIAKADGQPVGDF